jgi:tetratricopeptide (TPR) repeat protein
MKSRAFVVGTLLALTALASSVLAEPKPNPAKGMAGLSGRETLVSRGHFGRHFGGGPSNINILYGSSGRFFPGNGFGYGYGFGYPPYPYTPPYYGPYSYIGPLYIPADQLYGLGPLQRMMGYAPYVPPVNNNIIVAPRAGFGNGIAPVQPAVPFQADPPDDPPPERGTNAESVALARRILAVGDEYFQNQKFASAYQRYTSATKAAPQLADAYMRQGLSLVALGRYDQAVRTIKRAVEFDPGLSQSEFRLDILYGPNRMAKQAHLDALAKAATDQPEDSDLLFLLGFLLHFDGQTDRAKPFFQRAAQLAGNNQNHLTGFLN